MVQKQARLLDLAYSHPYYSYTEEALNILERLGGEAFLDDSGVYGLHFVRNTDLFNLSFWLPVDEAVAANLVDIRRRADDRFEIEYGCEQSTVSKHSDIEPDHLLELFQQVTGLALGLCTSEPPW